MYYQRLARNDCSHARPRQAFRRHSQRCTEQLAPHTCFQSHVQITEKDEAVLEHLVDLSCDELEGEEEAGFRLTFHFRENPFFSNTTLVRMGPSGTG